MLWSPRAPQALPLRTLGPGPDVATQKPSIGTPALYLWGPSERTRAFAAWGLRGLDFKTPWRQVGLAAGCVLPPDATHGPGAWGLPLLVPLGRQPLSRPDHHCSGPRGLRSPSCSRETYGLSPSSAVCLAVAERELAPPGPATVRARPPVRGPQAAPCARRRSSASRDCARSMPPRALRGRGETVRQTPGPLQTLPGRGGLNKAGRPVARHPEGLLGRRRLPPPPSHRGPQDSQCAAAPSRG